MLGASGPVTRFVALVRCIDRHRRRAAASLPTSHGTFIGAFVADRREIISISTQLQLTNPCTPPQLTCALGSVAPCHGSSRVDREKEPPAASCKNVSSGILVWPHTKAPKWPHFKPRSTPPDQSHQFSDMAHRNLGAIGIRCRAYHEFPRHWPENDQLE